MITYLVVPSRDDIGGNHRIVCCPGWFKAPMQSFKNSRDIWRVVGQVSFDGRLLEIEAEQEVWSRLTNNQPLTVGMSFEFKEKP